MWHDVVLVDCSSLVLVNVVCCHLLVVFEVDLQELTVVFPDDWSLAHFLLQILEKSVDALSVCVNCSFLLVVEECHFELENLNDTSQHFVGYQVELN